MNKQEAKNLIVNTFEKPFNEVQFTYFIKNLLNDLDESKRKEYRGQYVPDSFSDAVKHYKRIGQYKDSKNNVIDVLIVNLHRGTSLERARSLQRNFIARYLKQRTHDAALVAYYTDGNNDWRFSLVKMDINLNDKKIETDFSPARRYSFLVGANEGSHTAQNQFVKLLTEKEVNPTLDNIEDTFNIETVTKEFFLKYRELFIHIKQSLDKVIKNDSTIELEFKSKEINSVDFAKKLLGQIVFLYFLQKKGWFGVEKNSKWGSGSKKFLREIYEKKHGSYNNFFNDILEPLFYEALRNDRTHDDHYYSRFNCKIPFLNGGLFDPIGNYDWSKTDIILPNDIFSNTLQTKEGDTGDGILDVFDRYNFTVIEDEPLEKEVAIDPELLGKTYEKFNAIRPDNFDEYLKILKSGNKGEESKFNKQYGVFYTPREIVHYMCQQSLINYLTTGLDGKVSKESIEFLILEGEKFIEHLRTAKEKNENNEDYTGKYKESNHFLELKEYANEIDNLFTNLKMCDPAVGSGAFPVGMMTEIVKARMFLILTNCLDETYINPHNQKVKRNPYNFKRDCIENSLYGVDIDSGAVEIAKLRLWLSLVVDEDNFEEIRPLPNLDYKIVCGNSLIGVKKDLLNAHFFDELEKLKLLHFNETNPTKKQNHKRQIDELILKLSNGHKDFDFEVYFSEVFHQKGGFDILIANPPYVNISNLSKIQRELYKEIYTVTKNKVDLYAYFIERGNHILKKVGILTYIVPHTWKATTSFSILRALIFKNFELKVISELNYGAFEATVKPVVIILKKHKVQDYHISVLDSSFEPINYVHIKEVLQNDDFTFDTLSTTTEKLLFKKIENDTIPLKNICKFTRGIKTSNDEKFIKRDVIDSNCKKVIRGRNIKKYYYCWDGEYVWYRPDKMKEKVGSLPHNKKLFEVPEKLILQRISKGLAGSFDNERIYALDTCLVSDTKTLNNKYSLKFILGLINSRLLNFWYYKKFALPTVSGYELHQLPIKIVHDEIQQIIISLVNKILTVKQQNPQTDTKQLENQIDIMVYKLYNLTYEEVEIIDPQIGNIINKTDYMKFEIQ
ncbi:MAG: hypothetical protein FD143_1309 [Ignavibacteria bacterium]|nr:MAG: hypothetical protein FD143_1309 [Ignavibacteria bacterium]KAF0160828.1 MAG: hypothetical protein FD188_1433 [Ignavibacteria bacterium]